MAQPAVEPMIDFSADQVTYDTNAEVVTAEGRVRMVRDGNYLAADRVSWDRKVAASSRRATSLRSTLRVTS
jgi:LPS-assembly protein